MDEWLSSKRTLQDQVGNCSVEQLRVFVRHAAVSWPVLDTVVPQWQERLYVPLSGGTFHLLPPDVQQSVTYAVLAVKQRVPREIAIVIASYVAGLPWQPIQCNAY